MVTWVRVKVRAAVRVIVRVKAEVRVMITFKPEAAFELGLDHGRPKV